MEWWLWLVRWYLFCVRYSWLYWIYHKKHETLTEIPPIHVYLNRIDNRLVFKIKNGYNLELQTSETMKLFVSTKILIDKTRNRDNIPNLEVLAKWFYSNVI